MRQRGVRGNTDSILAQNERFVTETSTLCLQLADSDIVRALPRSTQPRDQHRSPVLCPELPPQHVCHVAVSLGEGATWSAHEVCACVSLSLKAEARVARRGQKNCHQPWAQLPHYYYDHYAHAGHT